MKQKLGLVCTLIHEPELIILDEPTTGVDPVSRRDFWAILAQLLQEKGVTALVSTAYLDEAERFARLALMFGGRIVAEGEPADIAGPAPSLEDAFIALLQQRGLIPDGELNNHVFEAGAEGSRHAGVAISARELTRDFDHFRAVDRMSFDVRQGEIFGLLGANGAGKTTVIKMLTGILPPSDGQGWVAGEDMRRASQAIKAHIGYVSQAFSLYPDLTCRENLRLFGRIYGVIGGHLGERIAELARLAGLDAVLGERVSRLPMGIRQRLALACALVHRPQVLFLDEPTSGVDPIGRRRFWEILTHLARVEGVAILLTTHYMSEAEHCDRLALMHAGKLVACDSPAALKAQLETQAGCVLDIAAEPVLPALEVLEGAALGDPTLFGRRIHLLARDADAVETRIRELFETRNIRLIGITRRSPSLEDVFTHRILQRQRGGGT
jgi:ABC-2 type transport system ATP-binding protein